MRSGNHGVFPKLADGIEAGTLHEKEFQFGGKKLSFGILKCEKLLELLPSPRIGITGTQLNSKDKRSLHLPMCHWDQDCVPKLRKLQNVNLLFVVYSCLPAALTLFQGIQCELKIS